MGEADRGSTAAYNYPRFDEYVAAGSDLADEDAFWASPRVGQRAPDFTLPRLGDGAGCPAAGPMAVQAAGDGVRLVHLTVLLSGGSSA